MNGGTSVLSQTAGAHEDRCIGFDFFIHNSVTEAPTHSATVNPAMSSGFIYSLLISK
jgi:hypothetical protein